MSEHDIKLFRGQSFAAKERPESIHQEQLNADKFGEEMKARCSSTLAPNFIQQRLVNPPHSRFGCLEKQTIQFGKFGLRHFCAGASTAQFCLLAHRCEDRFESLTFLLLSTGRPPGTGQRSGALSIP